jgi:integrase
MIDQICRLVFFAAMPISATARRSPAWFLVGLRSQTSLVFASRNGTPLNERNLSRRALKPAGEKLGIPWLSWHVFRHTHATLGEEIGMALSDRQAQMGHRDVRMTMHYTHSDLNRRRQAIEAMTDRLIGEPVSVVN